MKSIRPVLVWVHRWVGLGLAIFLIIEGLTGSLLAFRSELTVLLDPALAGKPPSAGAPRLDLATLIERAEAAEPRSGLRWLQPFTDDTAVFLMQPKIDPATRRAFVIEQPYVALDPWTGKVLKRMDESMYSDGVLPNVMPFVYLLHKSLYLGDVGVWILSVVALLWTLDCFWSFAVTLPITRRRFWSRWKPAWLIRWTAGTFRVNFDLHRANGLWLWPILFVLAWSSVALAPNTGAYGPVMKFLLGPEATLDLARPAGDGRIGPPRLDWHAALERGQDLIAEKARAQGFVPGAPQALSFDVDDRIYWYRAHTDRRFPRDELQDVYFDADTGAFRGSSGTYTGNWNSTVTNWLIELHMINDPVDYVVYRVFIVVVGLAIALLSMTGVYIWWKKRCARTALRLAPS